VKSGKNTHSMVMNNGHGEEGVILFRERTVEGREVRIKRTGYLMAVAR
jgi:hypothetical protein